MLGGLRRLVAVSVIAVLGTGCFPDATGVSPDLRKAYIYYPVGLDLTEPEGDYLVVANSNFDLLYNAGTVVPLELAPVREAIERCREGEGDQGCAEYLVPFENEVLDETFELVDYVLEEHAVGTGSYASTIVVTEGLAMVPVRADSSMHFIDVEEVPEDEIDRRRVLRCAWGEDADQPGGLQRCSSGRRIRSSTRTRDGATIGLPSEPFGVVPWSDPEDDRDYFVVGHMVGGQISLFERGEGPSEDALPDQCFDGDDDDGDGLMNLDDPGCAGVSVSLVDVEDSFDEGSSGLAVDHDGRFLVTSRFVSHLTSFRVGRGQISPVGAINVDIVNPGDNQRGVAVSPDGTLAYVASRAPNSVLVLDITHDEYGNYADRFLHAIEIGAGPSIIKVYADPDFAEGYLVYVVCFDEDRIFVIDPAINEVTDVITTHRGPYELVFDPETRVGYLVHFLESTISVLDVDPRSPRFHTILTSLGRPKRPRTND
jgi:YVTN family beta-propeller protein